jgi:hypothetical protein
METRHPEASGRILGVDCANVIFYPWRMEAVPDSVESLRTLAGSKRFEKIYLISRANPLTRAYYRFRLKHLKVWEITDIPKENLHFCWRNAEKALIAKRLGITDFIDDSLMVLSNMDNGVRTFAFHPSDQDAKYRSGILNRAVLEPISKVGRSHFPGLFEREARSSDEECRGLSRRKSRLGADRRQPKGKRTALGSFPRGEPTGH